MTSFARPPGASSLVLVAAVTLGGSAGCAFLKSLTSNNTINLEGADVKSVGVDIRKQQKTICPRERVQMAVFMEVTLKGDKAAKSVETWQGSGAVNKNDKLDFAEFAFHSDMGTFDGEGWFSPKGDMQVSAGKEFALTTAYMKQPDKFSFNTTYKPDYDCVKQAGKGGEGGPPGGGGKSGSDGATGKSGGTTEPGDNGGDGGDGDPGQDGGDGGDGPRIEAFATFVKTPFYEKLLAVRISGDVDDLLLAPADQPLKLVAAGGQGGSGGPGGNGGRGGGGGSGIKGGKGGTGGRGGSGGTGGRGGKGGEISLVFDERFPELNALFQLEVGGGAGGSPGPSGSSGSGGSAGPGTGQNGKMGSSGKDGPRGSDGRAGPAGPAGRASGKAGRVSDRFSGLTDITPLGEAAPVEPPKDEKPKDEKSKGDKGKGGKADKGKGPKK